jgi:hypothetical protein
MTRLASGTPVLKFSAVAAFGERLGFSPLLLLLGFFSAFPAIAQPQTQSQPPAGMQRLMQMFSPEIQATLNACQGKGGVNLAATTNQDGAIVCGDSSSVPQVSYRNYVNTTADLLAASSLVGLRAAMRSDPHLSPEQVMTALTSSEGSASLRRSMQTAIARTGLVSSNSAESSSRLADEIMGRLVPAFQGTNNLQNLLGTTVQYNQVVRQFCTVPGMSVEQAEQTIPGLNSVQLYAICVQESGLADELTQTVR